MPSRRRWCVIASVGVGPSYRFDAYPFNQGVSSLDNLFSGQFAGIHPLHSYLIGVATSAVLTLAALVTGVTSLLRAREDQARGYARCGRGHGRGSARGRPHGARRLPVEHVRPADKPSGRLGDWLGRPAAGTPLQGPACLGRYARRMDTTVTDPLVGRLLDGRYRVDGRLARGGMATVYRALDTRLDRPVALKVMHAGLAEDHAFVSRFIREARSAARLSHPGVVASTTRARTTARSSWPWSTSPAVPSATGCASGSG